MTRAWDGVLVALLAVVVVGLCANLAGPAWMNADTPILAVMSLQRPTLFFWGANRFLNLVPDAAAVLRAPWVNLGAQVLAFGGGFVGLLALIGRMVARGVFGSAARVDGWLCFAAVLFVFVAGASPYALEVFLPEGQPYGLAGLLGGVGLIAALRSRGWVGLVAGFAAMVLGGGLNPSLLLPGVALCGLVAVLEPGRRWRAMAVLPLVGVATVGWLAAGRLVAGPTGYGRFSVAGAAAKLAGAAHGVGQGLAGGPVLALGCVAAVAAGAWVIVRRGAAPTARVRWGVLAAVAGFAVLWVAGFGLNDWVGRNGWHFRYFYPVFLAGPVVIAAPVLAWLLRLPVEGRVACTAGLLLGCVGMLAAPPVWPGEYRVFARVSGAVATGCAAGAPCFVAGEYWRVWPAVFLVLARGGQAWGLEPERGAAGAMGARRALAGLRAAGEPALGICLGAPVARCVAEAGRLTGMTWREVAGREVAGRGCGVECAAIAAGG